MPAHSSRRSNASTPYAKLAPSFGLVVMSTTHCLPIVARRTRGRHRVPLTQNPWRIRSVSCVCGMRYCTRKPSARRSHSVPPIMHTPTHSTYPPLSACLAPTNAGAFATCRGCAAGAGNASPPAGTLRRPCAPDLQRPGLAARADADSLALCRRKSVPVAVH
ncbi:hypothetical protein C8R43DRAFT_369096 [Mycena crocata]|nr:hypothetical protein C8R43DRAFT_369096 [Mycena crocata]